MSEESLKQFINEKCLREQLIQDQLKATTDFDDFVNLMVELGNPEYNFTAEEVKAFVQKEIDKQKEKIQNRTNETKAELQKELEENNKLIEAQADQEKNAIDDAVANRWRDGRIVDTAIAELRDDDIRPCY